MAKISVDDHVHYFPENAEAESAGITPTHIVVFTNATRTGVVQLGAPGLSPVLSCLTKDLVLAEPDDLTEIQPADSE